MGETIKDRVQASVDVIRPMLQSHGGDIQLLTVDEGTGVVKVALQGACHGCPHAAQTLKMGVEAKIIEDVPEVKEVVAENM